MLSRFSFSVGIVAVLCGCSGDEAGAPEPPPGRPAIAGTYFISFRFDELPDPVLGGNGLVALGQPNQESPDLGGAVELQAVLGGQDFFPSWDVIGGISTHGTLESVSLQSGNALSFTLAAQGTQWSFTGTVSGTTAAGRHTLTDGVTTLSGDWSMYLHEIDQRTLRPSRTEGQCTGLLTDGTQYVSSNGTKTDCLTFCPFCNFTYGTIETRPD